MARIKNCAVCGKEVTTGLFKGDACTLEIADLVYVSVCPECYQKLKATEKAERVRFTTKLNNLKWETKRRLSNEEIVTAYVQYLEERASVSARKVSGDCLNIGGFYRYTKDGHFGWTERRMGFMGEDISLKDKAKAISKNIETDAFGFTKEDISCIEFRLANSDSLGMFKKAYSVDIRVNKETALSYKPCYTKTVVIVSGLMGYKKKAAAQMMETLQAFKQNIGSDLPIRQVKRFK